MIDFSFERMQRVEEAHQLWWEGRLDRPLMAVTLSDSHPLPRPLKTPILSQANCHDLSIPAADVIDAYDATLSTQTFLGDAYPYLGFTAYGPGCLAAFLGAKVDNHTGGVWFMPPKEMPISQLHLRYNPDHPWVRRIKDLYRAGFERWEGLVKMGVPDLGGVLDVLASFRGTENLLLELYDEPEEVLRLAGEIETAWMDAYRDFASVLAPQGGITDWNGLWSPKGGFIFQCDFCYMIGNPMFREFVLPTLQRCAKLFPHAIYHLDGRGQLAHLDDILAIPEYDAIQWVPGDGTPTGICWREVYEKITAAGKRYMVIGSAQDALDVISALHANPYVHLGLPAGQASLAQALLEAR